MELVVCQLYEFALALMLGVGLSFFYGCYRLWFQGGHCSRRQLMVLDSLWWLFAVIVTVGVLFFLAWGSVRGLFFLWLFVGFSLGHSVLWLPMWRKIKVIHLSKPGLPKALHSFKKKTEGCRPLGKPFDLAARGLYRGYACGKLHYGAMKKRQQEATAKWKAQIGTEKRKLKQQVLRLLWPLPEEATSGESPDLTEEKPPKDKKIAKKIKNK